MNNNAEQIFLAIIYSHLSISISRLSLLAGFLFSLFSAIQENIRLLVLLKLLATHRNPYRSQFSRLPHTSTCRFLALLLLLLLPLLPLPLLPRDDLRLMLPLALALLLLLALLAALLRGDGGEARAYAAATSLRPTGKNKVNVKQQATFIRGDTADTLLTHWS
jgi:hypothetical protein